MKTLIVEDDFTCRLLLQKILEEFGECHIAVNGREAVSAFGLSLEDGPLYDLVCMDIMMPEMDGQAALKQMRALEQERGRLSSDGAKIIMTTALDDIKNIAESFHELCDGYLTKPIRKAALLEKLHELKLIE